MHKTCDKKKSTYTIFYIRIIIINLLVACLTALLNK